MLAGSQSNERAMRFLRLFHALKSNWCTASPYSETRFKLAR